MSDTISKLVKYYGSDCQKSNARSSRVSKITIHHLAMVGNCDTIQRVIQSQCSSWNYGIGDDGKIGCYVTEDRRAWSGDTIANDDVAITIVVANSAVGGNYPVSEEAYLSLLSLCIDICRRYDISKLTHIPSNPSASTLTLHSQFNKTVTCPGTLLRSRINTICNHVNRALSGITEETKRYLPQISTYDAVADNVVVLNPKNVIKTQKFTPYVVTISESTKRIDIEALRRNKVSAAFLHAGYLYNSLHANRHTYEASNLASQFASVKQYDFPRGLIATVRARNIAEAREECKWLHLVVEKYPADLGIWLDCEFTNDKQTNGHILDIYLDEFRRWGVDTKCGLYINRNQLAKIDWNVYQVYFYLWLVDHSSSIPNVNDIIDPQFFNI